MLYRHEHNAQSILPKLYLQGLNAVNEGSFRQAGRQARMQAQGSCASGMSRLCMMPGTGIQVAEPAYHAL